MLPLGLILAKRLVRPYNLSIATLTKSKNDPGISHRKKLVKLDLEEDESMDFDDLESDFMDVHKSHRELINEGMMRRATIKNHIIKQKYFKAEKMPNFLTWHDKEQIRYLYRSNPDEWSVDQLAESFPALPAVIHKIVTSHWTKDQPHKVGNHDRAVQANWDQFKKGKMANLPPDLVQHLNKFTNRALQFHPIDSDNKEIASVSPKSVQGEYSSIISSYQNLKNKDNLEKTPVSYGKTKERRAIQAPPDGDTFYSPPAKKNSSKMVTLSELQLMEKKTPKEEEILIENSVEDNLGEIIDLSENKYPKSSTSVSNFVKKSSGDMSHLSYPEKITIPTKLHRKDATYKLNDCYYDQNGHFLYRVPGMS